MKGTRTFSSPSVEMRLANGAGTLLKQGSMKARRLIMKGRLGEHWDQGVIDSPSMGLNALWPAGVIPEKGASWW